MNKDYSDYLNKIVVDGIETKGNTFDIICGLKEVSCKLDTVISLLQVGLSRQQQPQEQHDKETLAVMTGAFRQAIRDNFAAEHKKPQDNNV